jgi:hypothetical protein
MQEHNFLSSHCVEKVHISLELFIIYYSSENHVKENTLLQCTVIFLLLKSSFQKKFKDS